MRSIINNRKSTSKIKLMSHGTVLFSILAFNIYHAEFLKSKQVISAILVDDLYSYRLIFRENGKIENHASGMFGYSATYYSTYIIKGRLIIFNNKPYKNNYMPDSLLIDKNQNALFEEIDLNGNFRTEKEWLNHYEIEYFSPSL